MMTESRHRNRACPSVSATNKIYIKFDHEGEDLFGAFLFVPGDEKSAIIKKFSFVKQFIIEKASLSCTFKKTCWQTHKDAVMQIKLNISFSLST